MKKRDRLIVNKTPENSFHMDTDDSIFLETPRPLKRREKNPSAVDFKPILPLIKNYCMYPLIILLLLLFGKMPFKQSPHVGEIRELKNEIRLLKEEGARPKADHESINVACIDRGCVVDYKQTSIPYSYGFMGRSHTDPHVVLSSSFDCYSFEGGRGRITLDLGEKRRICGAGIFHKRTEDLSSAPKDVVVYVGEKEVVKFVFDPKKIFTKVDFDEEVGNTVRFEIKGNHGKKKFTCVYRLFVYGK